tara:strand:+ start:33230 stop:33721 length:492 start_codon:yes stop_codon:yes gene_type:complete
MKRLLSILVLGIILLSFSFCCATKSNMKDLTQEKHPFKVTKSTYNNWVGGQPGVRGLKINITIDNPEIQLDTVFFRNKKMILKPSLISTSSTFIGVLTLSNTKTDYILHKNGGNEYGNKPPKVALDIPWKLKENEAVVSYVYEGNTHYYKIENVQKVKLNTKY